jgi:2'-5' RNA ligase
MRTFIAVDIPQEVKQKIDAVSASLKKYGGRVSWVRAANLHLTMKFLGEIDDGLLPGLKRALEERLSGSSRFQFTLKNLGAFPNFRRPRVIWIGIDSGVRELTDLAVRVDEATGSLGFEKETRPFSAHLTIARVKDPGTVTDLVSEVEKTGFESGPIDAEEVIIMKSQLTPRGSIYTALEQIKLH